MDHDITALGLIEDERIQLDAGALQIAALDHDGVELEPYLRILNAITDRIARIAEEAGRPDQQATVLAEVIGHEYGFRGDAASYDDPANGDLIRVIDRRKGLPVSLAILYVSQARRLGWQADVLNTPGHVLVRVGPETAPVLVDPFARGAILDAEALAAMLHRGLGTGIEVTSEHLAPMANRAVLVRLLMNQAVRAERSGDAPRAREVYRRITIVSPDVPHGWWERARLELAAGDVTAARASLSAMLEITRETSLRAHICAALEAIAG